MTSDDAWLGLADPESLVLERPVAAADWPRQPYVEIQGTDIAFWWARVAEIEGSYRATLDAEITTSGPGMLATFSGLASATGGAILAFARRWGALGICAHGLPRAHPPMASAPRSSYLCEEVRRPEGGDPIGHLESLAAWRYVAGRVRTVLDLAAGLWADPPNLGDPDRWRAVHREAPRDLPAARVELAAAVNTMVQLSQVRVWAAATPPYVRVGGHDVLGAIASQLLLVTARAEGWATCSSCGAAYAPSRKPQAGRRNYCPTCQEDGAPNRVAARNYRAARRQSA